MPFRFAENGPMCRRTVALHECAHAVAVVHLGWYALAEPGVSIAPCPHPLGIVTGQVGVRPRRPFRALSRRGLRLQLRRAVLTILAGPARSRLEHPDEPAEEFLEDSGSLVDIQQSLALLTSFHDDDKERADQDLVRLFRQAGDLVAAPPVGPAIEDLAMILLRRESLSAEEAAVTIRRLLFRHAPMPDREALAA